MNFKDFLKYSLCEKNSTYTVGSGDTLSTISQQLGIQNWKTLYDLNKKTIGEDPDSIKKGMVLEIPQGVEKKIEPVKNLFTNLPKEGGKKGDTDSKIRSEVKTQSNYLNWETLKKRKKELNSMSPSEIIKEFNKGTSNKYLILDKKSGKMKFYQGNKEILTLAVGIGQNFGDEQTKTVVRDGKVYWEEGNKMTGSGIYTVSGVNPKNPNYSDSPTWNFKNERGIEIPMAIHSSFGDRTEKINDGKPENNRLSNGCINGISSQLKSLYELGFKSGDKLYILPDSVENKFEISNGILVFKSKDPNVNKTVNTLNYRPIKIEINEPLFKKEVFQTFDFNDEKEYNNTTKPFVKSLQDNKQKVMKIAKINGDVYNDLAKIAFGIYGTESNFGDTHSALGNVFRAGKKFLSPSSSSSPDYMSKATTYGANKDSNSVGLTQIRFNMLDKSEKDILSKLGITDNKQLLKPRESALATVGILAARYKNQLNDEEKKDLMTNLPKKWNVRANYPDRVKNNSKYITIKELL